MYDNYDIHVLNEEGQWQLYITTSWKHSADSVLKVLLASGVTAVITPTMLRSTNEQH